MTHSRQPLVLPRGLIFLSSLWLIGCWVLSIGIRPPVQPSSASYTPSVRLMLQCVTIGLLIAWPMLRLSQRQPGYPVRQTLLDLVVLLGLVQVVIWPLRLVTNWTPLRTAAIDAVITAWVLLIGAVVAAALMTDRPGPRTLAMVACIGLCLLGPIAALVGLITGIDGATNMDFSPFMMVRGLGDGGGGQPSWQQWQSIWLLVAADIAAWIVLLIWSAVRR